jgi:hypothetical protein
MLVDGRDASALQNHFAMPVCLGVYLLPLASAAVHLFQDK